MSETGRPTLAEMLEHVAGKANETAGRYLSMLAGAYYCATSIPPEDAVLVQQTCADGTIRWWFERKQRWPADAYYRAGVGTFQDARGTVPAIRDGDPVAVWKPIEGEPVTEGAQARLEHCLFALEMVSGALSDAGVQTALAQSLLAGRSYPEYVRAIRDRLDAALLEAGCEETEAPG